ncbi:centrosomal protein of 131 kDa-like [Sitophilus oryzae]|uniref:Centrosomal protein of 131 kDa-like n=1 Tax=Sitophilus oryzae TaxID=7048 RepID=A0A6J2YKK2_SITOR|nr:centrosomal protein of 131 kDa-like [Sitophilus oryzae]
MSKGKEINSSSNNELKLTGDKINLEQRKLNTVNTASAKSSMFISKCFSRPVSALPRLNYSEKEDQSSKWDNRPFSADFVAKEQKYLSRGYLGSSVESIDDDKCLPSTQLYRNLLSESVTKSWKGYDVPSALVNNDDTSDFANESKENTCEESSSISSVDTLQPENIPYDGYSEMMPGLRTKPPLPKKTDHSVDDNTHTMDVIRDYFDIRYDTFKSRENSTVSIGNERNLNINDYNTHGYDYHANKIKENQQQESTTDLNNVSSSDLMYKDWLDEDITKKETETDKYLEKLKSEHCISNSNFTDNTKIVEKWSKVDEFPTLSSMDIDELFKDDTDKKFDKFFQHELNSDSSLDDVNKNKIVVKEPKVTKLKEKISGTTTPNITKKTLVNNKELPKSIVPKKIDSKQRFISKPIKGGKDYTDASRKSPDIETWMNRSCSKSKKTNYRDLLKNVSEIEQLSSVKTPEKIISECDADDKIEASSQISEGFDDLVSILEVLENEDKKSKKRIASVKNLVDSSLNQYDTKESEIKINPVHEQTTKNISLNNEEDTNLPEINQKRDPSERQVTFSPVVSQRNIESACSNNSDSPEPYCNTKFIYQDADFAVDRFNHKFAIKGDTNYNQLLSFLDEMDRKCSKSIKQAKENAMLATKITQSSLNLDTVPRIEDLESLSRQELASQLIDVHLRLKEKHSSISLLLNELSALRDQAVKHNSQTDNLVKQKLKQQKDEYEGVVKRHQKFIDQLIADKRALNQQCEGLIQEMKVVEDRYNTNTKALEHKHQVEIRKIKEMHAAGEKIRRERWIEGKTQKIKELTVKSIEPEIQSMEKRQQQELADMRALQKKEIEDIELRLVKKHQQQLEQLREQLTEEREKLLAHEREVVRQRYEKLVESEEKNYQEQNKRLQTEHANRMKECDERDEQAQVEKERAIKHAKEEFDDQLQVVIRRHSNELKLLKEATRLEFETWKANFNKNQATALIEKEAAIREQHRKERDQEIEKVIERLEREAGETKCQIEQSTENRISRLKEKYEKEIQDLETSEKEAKNKYLETKTKLIENEEVIIGLQASLKQLETQLNEYKQQTENFNKERAEMKEILRQEMKKEMEALEKEVAQLKNNRDKEIQQLYSRIKISVARKDEILNELQIEHKALQEKCIYLENMLEQQRKEYLVK